MKHLIIKLHRASPDILSDFATAVQDDPELPAGFKRGYLEELNQSLQQIPYIPEDTPLQEVLEIQHEMVWKAMKQMVDNTFEMLEFIL